MPGDLTTRTGNQGSAGLPAEAGGIPLLLSDLEFTDLYISESGKVLIRGVDDADGPLTEVPPEVVEDLGELQIAVMSRGQDRGDREFFVDYDGVRYRVSRIDDLSGVWYTLRKSKTRIPRLVELGGFAPPVLRHLGVLGNRSGLLLIAGATGQGKTTTACSLLREYMLHFGDIAVTIEDPPEMHLSGQHGNFGRCFQLKLERGETFGSALVSALRYTPRYILIGEIRKPEDAREVLRAAISGHLVISTIHAGSIEEAINSLVKLTASGDSTAEFARDMLANGLAGVIHQKLVRTRGKRMLKVRTLFTGEESAVRQHIREGTVSQLGTYIQQQESRVLNGKEPVEMKRR